MIGIVLVTHGRLGHALCEAMEHVVGVQRQLVTVPVGANEDISEVRATIERRLAEVDEGDGAVMLTDMFGSTPSNVCISIMQATGVEVISGVNLPMLVKLAKVRSSATLEECVGWAEAAGRKYIASASHLPPACLGGSACASLSARRPPEQTPAECGSVAVSDGALRAEPVR